MFSKLIRQARTQGRFYKTVAGPPAAGTNVIDLRSDTVTLPSDAMRNAMKNAIVGDDVYGEDPTVISLEKRCAALFNKEAALFVASGTMANLIAILTHCQRGEEIILGRDNHIHRWEHANYAQLAGVSATTLNNNADGSVNLQEIEASIRNSELYMPKSKLICLETTHNFSGGKTLPLSYMRSVRELANRNGLKVHLDGARIYNAAVNMGVEVADIAENVDTLQMCFSKGLGAPIGSILVGSKQFIKEANYKRKAIGGGWRQAGIMAAAANISLDTALETTKTDHARAQRLAREINKITPANLRESLYVVEDGITNMVILNCRNGLNSQMVASFFHSRNVLVFIFDENRIRMIPNCNLTDKDITRTLEVYQEYIQTITRKNVNSQ